MPSNASATQSQASDPTPATATNNKKMPYPKSDIRVNLDNHTSSTVYTSSSPVVGNVTITTKRDVRFDAIQILLIGSSKTRVVESLGTPQDVTHTLLKMAMPIPESSYPVPRVLETGHTYTFPFNFVIPNHLTINACNHPMESNRLLDQHVLLPPSMGNWEKDDMAPQMARVEYTIKARVLHQPDLGGSTLRIMEATQNLNVLPASVEEPPLSITEEDRLYTMCQSKSVRKTVLATKLGTLTAEGIQPGPAVLKSDGTGMVAPTNGQIRLKFEPASVDTPPPKVTNVYGKIAAHTFFSSGTIPNFPNMGHWNEQFVDHKRGVYSTTAALPPVSFKPNKWQQHITSTARRDSGYSTDNGREEPPAFDSDSGSSTNQTSSRRQQQRRRSSRQSTQSSSSSSSKRQPPQAPIYHTTTQEIQFALPVEKKTFIPTFHSCIVSRVYTLQLSLTVAIGSTTKTMSLVLPLQVMVEWCPPESDSAGLPSFETAVQEAEADEHLRPRVMHVPEDRYRETSVLPGYGA
ncbi:arrestin [Naviculisporaceae sp. PSN 640]